VPEPTGNRADIDACRDQLGSGVVPQFVNRGRYAKTPSEPGVSLADRVRLQVHRPIDRQGKHKGIVDKR
jgi:hypothetical protein